MSIFVTELGNVQRMMRGGLANLTPIRSYNMSSGGSSGTTSGAVQGTCQYVRVSADAASFFAISSSTGLGTLTSTNAVRLPANVAPEYFAVPPGASLMAQST